MTKRGVWGFSPLKNEIVAYVNDLIASGQPFHISKAAETLGRDGALILANLRRMQAGGNLVLESRRSGQITRYRILMPDGRVSPWPGEVAPVPSHPKHDEIIARRIEVEEVREARRRYWLERERAPRQRDLPRDVIFLDKATVQALQGLSHG